MRLPLIRVFTRVAILCACALGCETTSAAPDDPASTGSAEGSSTGTGGTTYDLPTACEGSDECDPAFCVAPYDAGATATSGMGDAVCVDACVPALALDKWCVDDAACCGGLECNAGDGLCLGPGDDSSTSVGDSWATLDSSGGSGTSSSDDGTTTDGTSTGPSTESGTSSTSA